MSDTCTHDCSTCQSDCSSREIPKETPNELTHIKKMIGVVSGKGGVGKSLVTALSAVQMTREGYKCAVLDADITGPSVPKMFGLTEHAEGSEQGIYPVASKTGIEVMSINLLLENEADPVLWRGPIIGGTVKQFYTDVIWGDIDFMFVDMPPGTGDVALSVFQSLPVDGIIIVTSPQELVSMIVGKAVRMAELMNIPVLGVAENMSYLKCPDCGREIDVFGHAGDADRVARDFELPVLARIPIDPAYAAACDSGTIELAHAEALAPLVDCLKSMLEK